MRRACVIIAVVFLAVCCGRGTGQQQSDALRTRHIPQPSVPGVITDNDARMVYMAEHWWNAVADTSIHAYRCDSLYVGGIAKTEVEGYFANFIQILSGLSPESAKSCVRLFYDKISLCEQADTSSNVFEQMVGITDSFLYDPNSPLRDEDLYQPFAEALSFDARIDSLSRARYAREERLCLLNGRGAVAADFTFCDRFGKVRTLHSLKADYTVLFFSNPGCEACKAIIDQLGSYPDMDALIASGRIAVANVYIDEDLAGWYDYMPIYPENWFNGYDPNMVIRTDGLYHVRAIPSLYLLDGEKRVILKDSPEERFFRTLEGLLYGGQIAD